MKPHTRLLDVPIPGAPVVHLLDATGWTSEERELRAVARSITASAPPRYSSRSYAFPLALVALHAEPVGVDIELVASWGPARTASILTVTERQRRSPLDDRRATSVWSSKEALAKALDTPIHYDPRRLESPAFWPNGAAGRWRSYRLKVPEAYEAWLCWRVCDANGHHQIREE